MNVEPEEEDGWLFAHYATSHTKERQQKKAESKLIRQRRHKIDKNRLVENSGAHTVEKASKLTQQKANT